MKKNEIVKNLKTLKRMSEINKYKVSEVLTANPNFDINKEIFEVGTFNTFNLEDIDIHKKIVDEIGLGYYVSKSQNFDTMELAAVANLEVFNTEEIEDINLLKNGVGNIKNPIYIKKDGVAVFLTAKTLRSEAIRAIRERLNESDGVFIPETILERSEV